MRQLFSALLLCLASAALPAQTLETFVSQQLDTYVEAALKRWQIPGAAVCVVKDGKVLIARGYGIRQLGRSERVDENTLFEIGSNTKAFTGTALALLADDKKCTLDDKVQRWLPDFRMRDEWVARELTLTDILCHRMGMETFQGDFTYWTSDLTSAEVIRKFGLMTPQYGFRSRWGYTNAGFAIAGEAIRAISGQTWGDVVKTRIFQPLAMQRTVAYSAEFARADNAAQPHTIIAGRPEAQPVALIDNLAPAGSIGSSVLDLSHWLIAQLDSGRYAGQRVLPWNALARTRQPESMLGRAGTPFNRSHYQLYALGWFLQDYAGREIVSHTGGVNGFVTSVTLLPEEKIGIVVLTNTDANAFYESLKWELIDVALGLPYRDYDRFYFDDYTAQQTKADAEIATWRDSVRRNVSPGLPLPAYTGRYENPVYGWVDISKEGTAQLTMTFQHHPALRGRLESLGNQRFLCTYSDPIMGVKVLPFRMEGNRVLGFALSVADFVEFTPYEFVKK